MNRALWATIFLLLTENSLGEARALTSSLLCMCTEMTIIIIIIIIIIIVVFYHFPDIEALEEALHVSLLALALEKTQVGEGTFVVFQSSISFGVVGFLPANFGCKLWCFKLVR